MIRLTASAVLTCLCALLLAACGEADDAPDAGAASALSQTFAATSKIENATLDASFRLEPDGPLALGGPIVFRASGPFAAPSAAGRLPRFDLTLSGSLGALPVRAGVISTGGKGYLRLGGETYRVGDEFVDAVREALAGGKGFAALGLDPATWIVDPRSQGTARVGGVETERIAGEIDAKRLLADVARLLGGAGADGFLTPRMRDEIAAAVKSARVELWSGTQDRILRQLAIAIDFAVEDKQARRSMGLEGGRIDLRIRLNDVNETRVDIAAPKGARKLSSLAGAGGLGALLGGLDLGANGAAGPGDDGEAFLKCLESADGSSGAVARCASKLAP